MYNKKDIGLLEVKITATIASEGGDETPGVEKLINEITGPSTGLVYQPGPGGSPGSLHLAEGWIFDNDGNIVRLEDATGPATGMVYRNGKLVKAE